MKRFGKYLFYALLFLWFAIIFTPKDLLYYKGERLVKDNVVISNEVVLDEWIRMIVESGEIFAKGIKVGSFSKVALYPELWVNVLEMEGFSLDKALPMELTIDRLFVVYTPFYPIKLFLKGEGSIGTLNGWIDLRKRQVRIDIASKKQLDRMWQGIAKVEKVKEGLYRYEYRF